MKELYVGFRGFLVPARPTAPTAAYRQPAVTVVAVDGPRVTVQLDGDGTRVETDQANVKRQPLAPRETTRPAPARPELPAGYTEETLF